jgi:dolichol-phosphate mannosyltransferase
MNPDRNRISLSVVIPCFNESENLVKLYRELYTVLDKERLSCEFLFIDDGSTDETIRVLDDLSGTDSRVRYISFSRNFGHQQALRAGLRESKGLVVITMDADLQHPPGLIAELVTKWKEGYEVVHTVRTDGVDTGFIKRATSRLFYKFMNFISDIRFDPGMADFRLLDREVVDVINDCPESDLFLRGMVVWCGFRQVKVPYTAQKRFAGKTKYSYRKMLSFAVNGITSFSIRPLKLSILLSFFLGFLSFCEIVYILYIAFFTSQSISGWASLAILISVLGAIILLMLGVIGEYLGRLFMQSKNRPPYIIRKNLNDPLF